MTEFRFDRLVTTTSPHGNAYVECVCDCGTIKSVRSDHLTSGRTRSCGCLMRKMTVDRNWKHGEGGRTQRSDELNAWNLMKTRCHNPKNKVYHRYGGRGISVCDRWKESFSNFLADMGRKPTKAHSLDRKDVNGNYDPTNCRWATQAQQCQNQRRNTINAEIAANIRALNEQGVPKTEISRRLGVHYSTVKQVASGRQWAVPEVAA